MFIELLKRLEKSKWLPWIGTAPFIIIPLKLMFDGEMSRGLGLFAFFGSMLGGIASGAAAARFLNAHLLKGSDRFGERLSAAFSAFGFLFLPSVVGSWANAYLGTDIDMLSLGAHFMWACIAGGIFFCVSSPKSGNAD